MCAPILYFLLQMHLRTFMFTIQIGRIMFKILKWFLVRMRDIMFLIRVLYQRRHTPFLICGHFFLCLLVWRFSLDDKVENVPSIKHKKVVLRHLTGPSLPPNSLGALMLELYPRIMATAVAPQFRTKEQMTWLVLNRKSISWSKTLPIRACPQ